MLKMGEMPISGDNCWNVQMGRVLQGGVGGESEVTTFYLFKTEIKVHASKHIRKHEMKACITT